MASIDLLGTEESRQRKSSNYPEERALREVAVDRLLRGIVGRHTEYFRDPQNRVNFLAGKDPDDFLRLAQYINAKLRSEKATGVA